jgi:hypothetical protein
MKKTTITIVLTKTEKLTPKEIQKIELDILDYACNTFDDYGGMMGVAYVKTKQSNCIGE